MSVFFRLQLPAVFTAIALGIVVGGCGGPPPAAETKAAAPAVAPAHDAAMQLHHLHGLMAHGFEMALEGANLTMLGQMGMAPAVDRVAASHGDAMVTEGKALIDRSLNGPAMTALHSPAGVTDPGMTYTHDLGKAMMAVLDHFQQMPPVNPKNTKDMALHHMHVALAHAAVMASQAAALKMTAAMKMAGPADEEAATHATAMFAHARGLYDETMKGDAMKGAHAAAASDKGMTGTHEIGDSVNTVIDLLSKMP